MCREEIAINYMHSIFMAQLISEILTIYYIIYTYIVHPNKIDEHDSVP